MLLCKPMKLNLFLIDLFLSDIVPVSNHWSIQMTCSTWVTNPIRKLSSPTFRVFIVNFLVDNHRRWCANVGEQSFDWFLLSLLRNKYPYKHKHPQCWFCRVTTIVNRWQSDGTHQTYSAMLISSLSSEFRQKRQTLSNDRWFSNQWHR